MRRFPGLILFSIFVSFSFCGCTTEWSERFATYLPMQSALDQSINGNTVFQELCISRGARARQISWVNSRCKDYDCIIWFCTDNQLPETGAVEWFENWLTDHPNKTLVFVGRSFESDALYWKAVAAHAPFDQKKRVELKRNFANSELARDFKGSRLQKLVPDPNGDDSWFTLRKFNKPFVLGQLQGEPQWTDGIDPAKTEIEFYGGIVPTGDDVKILLSAKAATDSTNPDTGKQENDPTTPENDAEIAEEPEKLEKQEKKPALDSGKTGTDRTEILVAEKKIGQGRILMLPNASFLLNYPLVNKENRKLATRLVEELQPSKKRFLFLRMGNKLVERDDFNPAEGNRGLMLLQIWPIAFFFWHLIFLGIVLCFWKWPIFGKTKELPPVETTDFKLHIDAYASLLARTGDYRFVEEELAKLRGTGSKQTPS